MSKRNVLLVRDDTHKRLKGAAMGKGVKIHYHLADDAINAGLDVLFGRHACIPVKDGKPTPKPPTTNKEGGKGE